MDDACCQSRYQGKRGCVKLRELFVNWTPLQLTLRELRETYTDRRALALMAAVGAVLGLLGPFGTYSHLNTGMRILYWCLVSFSTTGAAYGAGRLVSRWLLGDDAPLPVRILVMAAGAAVPVSLAVSVINAIFFAAPVFPGWGVVLLVVYSFLISLAVFGLIDGFLVPMLRPDPPAPATPSSPAIFARLSPELRGRLSHLTMADHYVEVHTSRGKAMVLMRFADAMAETQGVEGLQIHRSHWVARDAVAAMTKVDGKSVVTLVTGQRLPVSRSYLEAARAAFN